MGKNTSAEECSKCGNLIYYGGDCMECKSERDMWLAEIEFAKLETRREIATEHINKHYISGMEIYDLFDAIWWASTEILPHLEVQVVIDSNDKIHVSTGSAGYVDFQINPVGMKLPIKCWIHTHPFGKAYFSGTDIRTVSVWQPIMNNAIVLGGTDHYGLWEQKRPNELDIYVNNEYEETQVWNQRRSEEE